MAAAGSGVQRQLAYRSTDQHTPAGPPLSPSPPPAAPLAQALFDLQLASVKALHPPSQPALDPQPRLHALTERYAHLTASVLLLHADFMDGPLDSNIDRLRYAGGCGG